VESESVSSFESIDVSGDDASRAARLVIAGELVAAITHDLRQPLTALEMNVAAALNRLELSPMDESPGHAAERLQAVADALRDALAEQRRMREALQVLQDLAARREPSFAPVDLGESVREVVRLVSTDSFARHIHVDVNAPADLPRVSADAALVRQALLNILLDSLEATSSSAHKQGPVVVTVCSQKPGTVDVVITHFGDRADTSGGLGLALARSVAGAHGGSLRVTGDSEHGVAVTTRWPIRNGGQAVPTREARHADD
jgi:signal transduction histidine kinase